METKDLEQKRDDLKAQLKAVKKQIKQLKPADGWYLTESGNKFIMYLKDGIYQFGINSADRWKTNGIKCDYDNYYDRLATPEEVTQRLTEFVNRLGYVKGVNVKALYINEVLTLSDKNVFFMKGENEYFITYGGIDIWSSIKGFAKIIEQPKFKVELIRREADVFSFIKITHGADVNSHELVKQIETDLNSKP